MVFSFRKRAGAREELARQLAGVGSLVEPARRELYLHVAAQPDAVSREDAAAATGLPLHSVKFHLDRLVDEGLLETEFRRLSGRSGPGAGRPSKLYRRSARQLSVSLPERHYDLAGEVLASAIETAMREGTPVADAVAAAAREAGHRIVSAHAEQGEAEDGGDGELERVAAVLGEHGYEPRLADHEVCLANCPFDRMAADHTELVCGMNHALIGAVVDGLGAREARAVLDPQPGFCCVKVRAGH